MLPWSDIDTLLFDMDGTLLDLQFDSFFWRQFLPKRLNQIHGGGEEQALQMLHQRYQQVQGTLQWYCFDFWSNELDVDIAELMLSVSDRVSVRPNVEVLLSACLASSKRLVLVTNAHTINMNIKLAKTGIGKYFEHHISSHDIGLAKENPGFWLNLSKSLPFEPANTALFDDTLSVLQQADQEGIKHLYGIHQPNSGESPLDSFAYPRIMNFLDILPPKIDN